MAVQDFVSTRLSCLYIAPRHSQTSLRRDPDKPLQSTQHPMSYNRTTQWQHPRCGKQIQEAAEEILMSPTPTNVSGIWASQKRDTVNTYILDVLWLASVPQGSMC